LAALTLWCARAGKASQSNSAPLQIGATTALALGGVLNPDGTLKVDASGSFAANGYRMEYTATGAPRFVAQANCGVNDWDSRFGLPNGTNGSVYALAVVGNDIYLGGSFDVAGNVAANNIARYNTLTGVWSALGTGGNGVNGIVLALLVSGSDLYVGGFFRQANVGAAPIKANYLAQYNTTTGVWSLEHTGHGRRQWVK
jgi:hypothetical protein